MMEMSQLAVVTLVMCNCTVENAMESLKVQAKSLRGFVHDKNTCDAASI